MRGGEDHLKHAAGLDRKRKPALHRLYQSEIPKNIIDVFEAPWLEAQSSACLVQGPYQRGAQLDGALEPFPPGRPAPNRSIKDDLHAAVFLDAELAHF